MIEIDLTVTLRSPLNIGSGSRQATLAKQPLLKNRSGWPYIPASTIKGKTRHAAEQIAATLGATVCATHHQMCRHTPCAVCRVFGAPWFPGTLQFNDLILSGPAYVVSLQEEPTPPRTETRMGVAINRRRRTAEEQHLFSTELLFPGVPLEFSGALRGAVARGEAALVVAAIQHLFAVGRAKSRGLGWLEVSTLTVRENGAVVAAADLRAALEEVG